MSDNNDEKHNIVKRVKLTDTAKGKARKWSDFGEMYWTQGHQRRFLKRLGHLEKKQLIGHYLRRSESIAIEK